MKKIYMLIITLFIILLTISVSAQAATMADTEFLSATTSLSSSRKATFSACTYDEKDSITVTQVRLYKQTSSGSWSYIRDLPVPDNEATNTVLYGASADYSDYIGSGTYRLYTTFCADGHSISRYSNTRTY